MTETILAAQIEVGEHHTATWLGLTVNTDTIMSTAIAGVIVIALAFFLRAKVTSTDVPNGVQLFWEAITWGGAQGYKTLDLGRTASRYGTVRAQRRSIRRPGSGGRLR